MWYYEIQYACKMRKHTNNILIYKNRQLVTQLKNFFKGVDESFDVCGVINREFSVFSLAST